MCHNDGDWRFVRDIHLSHGNRFSPRKGDLGFWLGGYTCQMEMHRKPNLYMLDNV